MSSAVPDAVALNMLQGQYGLVATTAPATYYAGLSTTAPTDNNGTGITEPTDANYARVAVTNNTTNFTTGTRQVANGTTWTWPASTSGGSGYGSVGWIPLYTAAAGGTFCGYLIVTGGPVSLAAGIAPAINPGGAALDVAA